MGLYDVIVELWEFDNSESGFDVLVNLCLVWIWKFLVNLIILIW